MNSLLRAESSAHENEPQPAAPFTENRETIEKCYWNQPVLKVAMTRLNSFPLQTLGHPMTVF